MLTLTAKIRLFPSQDEAIMLHKTMLRYRDACNYVADYIDKTHSLSMCDIHKALYYDIREKFGLNAQMTQSVFRTVVSKFKAILTSQKQWIKPSFRHPQCDFVQNRDYSFLNNQVCSLRTLEKRIKLPFQTKGYSQFFDGSWKIGSAKLITKKNKWFLLVSISKENPEFNSSLANTVVGIDLGINFLATAYDSNGKTLFFNGRSVKQKRAHYKQLRRELQQRQTASARRRLRNIGHRENGWMRDANHCITKALVAQYPENTLFVLEDLTGIRNATEKVALHHRYETVSWSFADFRQKLEYKALRNHQLVIAVDPKYTSQTCPKCGHVDKQNRDKKNHVFCCKSCGYRSNDDRIGAINLYQKGIQYLCTVTAE